ncbi:hypothetical protein T492DRAFT_165708 [Pavlovales sp. CCMP2436]|nr:hypothetical protein T492DRAFT_165708 [Pavlovales sp. CCMP2436]
MADGAKTPSTNHMALVCVLECDGLLAKRGWEPGAPVVAILVSAGLPTRSGRVPCVLRTRVLDPPLVSPSASAAHLRDSQNIELCLHSEAAGGAADPAVFLGRVTWDLARLPRREVTERWCPVEKRTARSRVQGARVSASGTAQPAPLARRRRPHRRPRRALSHRLSSITSWRSS